MLEKINKIGLNIPFMIDLSVKAYISIMIAFTVIIAQM